MYVSMNVAKVLALLGSFLQIALQLKEVKLPTLIESGSVLSIPLHLKEVKLPTLIESEVKLSTRTELNQIEEYKTFLENWVSFKKCLDQGRITEFGFLL